MKVQIQRFPVHQNAKVFAIMMAVVSLVFVIPFFLIASVFGPKAQGFPSGFFILALPVMYLIMTYIMTAIGCLIYNGLAKLTGGLQFESDSAEV